MFTTLQPAIQEELRDLSARFGAPRVHSIELYPSQIFDPLSARDRYGEVCMVIRRPNGRLLTAKKTFYPVGAYRLLTGGINLGESVLVALLREVQEETGLEVVVRRFLAAVAYRLPAYQEDPTFYTFAFLLDEVGGVLENHDPSELVEYFREIAPEELPERVTFFETLEAEPSRELGGYVSDWGKFRAVIHQQVWLALA